MGGLRRMVESLGARLVVEVQWQGAELDRLLDGDHAALVEGIATYLAARRWDVRPEVSFNVFGERGRFDLLGWDVGTGILLVVEVKTLIGDLQDAIGRLDVKVRLAPRLAPQEGWRVRRVVPLLVLAEHPTNRRVVAAHPATFHRFTLRGGQARRWLRSPGLAAVPNGVLIFRNLSVAPEGSRKPRL